jgi:hypothetical protein
LNIGVSRNRFCDFLADPDSRSFSRFGAIIMQFAVTDRKHSIFNLSIVAVSALTVKWMEKRISAANRFAPAFFQERCV